MADSISEKVLAEELAHYRARRSEADGLVNQRLTMLISILAGAVAATVALLGRVPSESSVSLTGLTASIWIVLALVSEAIFLRLVRARLAICTSIRIVNLLRVHLANQVDPLTKEILDRAYLFDRNPPEPYALISSPQAPALVVSASALLALWLETGYGHQMTPMWIVFVPCAMLLLNNVSFWTRARRWGRPVTASPVLVGCNLNASRQTTLPESI